MNKDFCIMPFKNIRLNNTERHEIFFGGKNRKKSIEYGLVVFLTQEEHRGTNGIHGKNGHEFDIFLKQEGQKAFMQYYDKTVEEFIKEFGRNYID